MGITQDGRTDAEKLHDLRTTLLTTLKRARQAESERDDALLMLKSLTLTKREHFASMAMQGFIASGVMWGGHDALAAADELLRVLGSDDA